MSDSSTGWRQLAMSELSVDLAVLTSFDDGDPGLGSDLVVELIDLFLDDIPQKLRAMRTALSVEDLQPIKNIAHNLKGSSSSLGANRLASLCEELESASNDLWIQEVDTLLTKVEQEIERVRLVFEAERLKRTSC